MPEALLLVTHLLTVFTKAKLRPGIILRSSVLCTNPHPCCGKCPHDAQPLDTGHLEDHRQLHPGTHMTWATHVPAAT